MNLDSQVRVILVGWLSPSFLFSPAPLRENLVHWLKTGTRFGGRTRVARGCAGGFGGRRQRGFVGFW